MFYNRREGRTQKGSPELRQRNLSCPHDEILVADLAVARNIIGNFAAIWGIDHYHLRQLILEQKLEDRQVPGVAQNEAMVADRPEVTYTAQGSRNFVTQIDPILRALLIAVIEIDDPVDLESVEAG